MLNILKYFQQPPVEKYEFQDAEHMPDDDEVFSSRFQHFMDDEDDDIRPGRRTSRDRMQDEQQADMGRAGKPNLFAQNLQDAVQRDADDILEKARAEAAEIIRQARIDADEEADALYKEMRQKGYDEGFAQGCEEGRKAGEERAYKESRDQIRKREEKVLDQVERFLRDADNERDQLLDRYQDEMRDLALTVAEKIIRISLQSSGEIVARMVQHATEKLKHREWVRVYIHKGEAQRCVQADPELAACLSMLADQVKIVPMESDDPGTCILEMPDEIIDASASTQLENIRGILQDMKG